MFLSQFCKAAIIRILYRMAIVFTKKPVTHLTATGYFCMFKKNLYITHLAPEGAGAYASIREFFKVLGVFTYWRTGPLAKFINLFVTTSRILL